MLYTKDQKPVMLSKENRLKKKKDFGKVLKLGKGFKQKALLLKTAKNDLPQTRFGFIVSKRTAKKATDRNKIKRQMREIVRKNIGNIKKGYDVVVIAWPDIKERNFKEKSAIIEETFKKINFLEK